MHRSLVCLVLALPLAGQKPAPFEVEEATIARKGTGAERERTRDLTVLHDKMRSTGRRIDAAERRLRN